MISDIQKHLLSLKEEGYIEFHKCLCTTNKQPMIGIRVPVIREYAKTLAKQDNVVFKDEYYEEVMLHGLYIGYKKDDYKTKVKEINKFIPLIDNWAVCDSFVSTLKIIKENKDDYFTKLDKYIKSNKEYYQRYAQVVLLNYYVDDKYLNDIFKILKTIKYNGYYSLMAGAWLLSYCFIFDFKKTYNFVKKNKLNEFVYKKGIQKSLDSYRVSKSNKQLLRSLTKQL